MNCIQRWKDFYFLDSRNNYKNCLFMGQWVVCLIGGHALKLGVLERCSTVLIFVTVTHLSAFPYSFIHQISPSSKSLYLLPHSLIFQRTRNSILLRLFVRLSFQSKSGKHSLFLAPILCCLHWYIASPRNIFLSPLSFTHWIFVSSQPFYPYVYMRAKISGKAFTVVPISLVLINRN